MITSKGRELIGKYMLGQSDYYAEYLAIGCGYNHIADYEYSRTDRTRQCLEYEMVRVPIISKGLIGEIENMSIAIETWTIASNEVTVVLASTPNFLVGDPISVTLTGASPAVTAQLVYVTGIAGKTITFDYTHINQSSTGGTITFDKTVTKLTLKAQLPTEQRFKITEVGVFSDHSNSLAGAFDSKKISGFLPEENWTTKDSVSIEVETESLVNVNNEIINPAPAGIGEVGACFVTDENAAWDHPARKITLQPPRYFDHSLLACGNFSAITKAGSVYYPSASAQHIKTNSIPLNLNENNANDQIKIAYSLIPANPNSYILPDKVFIVLDFLNDYATTPSYARWQIEKEGSDFVVDGENYFYKVETTTKSDFIPSLSTFSWAGINGVRIYVAVTDLAGASDSNWYVLLDGVRLENVSTQNPLYGLVGYSVMETPTGQPVIKRNNTVNFIEYRFTVDV